MKNVLIPLLLAAMSGGVSTSTPEDAKVKVAITGAVERPAFYELAPQACIFEGLMESGELLKNEEYGPTKVVEIHRGEQKFKIRREDWNREDLEFHPWQADDKLIVPLIVW